MNIKKIGFIALTGLIFILALLIAGGTKAIHKSDCRFKNKLDGYKFYLLFPHAPFPVENTNDKCYYEFYNAVYEASTFDINQYKKLDEICGHINVSFPTKSWDQCYFRLGIAIAYVPRYKISTISRLQEFIDKKIKFCEGLSKNKLDCVVGVYTGINIAYQNNDKDSTYPLKNNDPFWVCKTGAGVKYKLQCFRNMVSLIYGFTGYNHDLAVKLIVDNLDDPFERFELLLTYFSSLAYIPQISYSDIEKICTRYKDKLTKYACIEGYATGIDEVAINGQEGLEVAKFCLSSKFSFDERGECIRRGFFELPTTWELSVKKQECEDIVPLIYKRYCDVGADMPIPASADPLKI